MQKTYGISLVVISSLLFGSLFFKEKLGAELIIKHGMKHFSGAADGENSCVELPDVVESVLKM